MRGGLFQNFMYEDRILLKTIYLETPYLQICLIKLSKYNRDVNFVIDFALEIARFIIIIISKILNNCKMNKIKNLYYSKKTIIFNKILKINYNKITL
jgi:hypothetical protein